MAMRVIVILHAVGVGFMVSPYREMILPLSSLNLAISGILALAFHPDIKDKKFVLWALAAFSTGMITEGIGVHTSILFGKYQYLDNLGIKLFGVPLIIGLNWTYLAVGASSLAFRLVKNVWLQALLAAGLMTLFDFFMEPNAILLDYWNWFGEPIPLKNYISWFVIGFALCWVYLKTIPNKVSNVAVLLYCVQLAFFAILTLVN
jgi:putative membrane protein